MTPLQSSINLRAYISFKSNSKSPYNQPEKTTLSEVYNKHKKREIVIHLYEGKKKIQEVPQDIKREKIIIIRGKKEILF
jgi:hypothetical protein